MKIIRSLGLRLDEEALKAVQQWWFKPAMKDGKPSDIGARSMWDFICFDGLSEKPHQSDSAANRLECELPKDSLMKSGFKGTLVSAACMACGIFPAIGYGQDPLAPSPKADRAAQATEDSGPQPAKRVFWIIPNYRTYQSLANYKPLTKREKFKIATQDSFDRGTVAMALAFAGERQLTHASPSFGQGVEGYAHYFGTAYADFVVGDYMTEAVFPSLLHQDPRYFRRGTGSFKSRLGYAMGQIFWTHTDSGSHQFNYSELAGNATAAAISNAYYPDNRSAANWATQFGTQIGLDMAGNVLKEFWPDIYGKLARKHHEP